LRQRVAVSEAPYEPCLAKPAKAPPTGPGWIHEIKHDGFRIVAGSKPAASACAGYDFTARFAATVVFLGNRCGAEPYSLSSQNRIPGFHRLIAQRCLRTTTSVGRARISI
jgi:hypothetical protein